MARLILRVYPNPDPDPVMAKIRSQPGDVVDICEDSHIFTDAEYRLYLVVNVPGIPAETFDHLKAHDVDADGNMLAYRKVRLDHAALNAEIANVRASLRPPLSDPDIVANTKVRN